MTKIKLNDEGLTLNLSVLIETKLALLANSGGGKSWAIRKIVEESFGKKQIIIIDPESEYGNLRKKYDFILAGEGGETITKPHIAAKLAERLMELKASAIIDLYDLLPQDRKRFVRLFLDSLMNLPKHLQTDLILIIDEAHVFAPEGKPSEASSSMEALASQGRKRNIGPVFATQRISKMSKDVLAECNNKMIGRMNLDIDRKRAAEELGFASKEQVLSLRNLKPGNFYMFGPAISDDVVLGAIGNVNILPPKRGSKVTNIVPPTAGVKKLIAQLADLPQEVQKEAQTVAELKTKIKELETAQRGRFDIKKEIVIDAQAVANAVNAAEKKFRAEKAEVIAEYKMVVDLLSKIKKVAALIPETFRVFENKSYPLMTTKSSEIVLPRNIEAGGIVHIKAETYGMPSSTLAQGERIVLNAIAQFPEGMTTEHLAVLTGYKNTSRRTYLQKLAASGYIRKEGEEYFATEEGIEALGSDFKPLPTGEELRSHLLSTLPEGEKKVLTAILDSHPSAISRQDLEAATNYKTTSVRTYLQKLSARKVIDSEGGLIKASDKLF